MGDDDKNTVVRAVTRGGVSAVMPYAVIIGGGVVAYHYLKDDLQDFGLGIGDSANSVVEKITETTERITDSAESTINNITNTYTDIKEDIEDKKEDIKEDIWKAKNEIPKKTVDNFKPGTESPLAASKKSSSGSSKRIGPAISSYIMAGTGEPIKLGSGGNVAKTTKKKSDDAKLTIWKSKNEIPKKVVDNFKPGTESPLAASKKSSSGSSKKSSSGSSKSSGSGTKYSTKIKRAFS